MSVRLDEVDQSNSFHSRERDQHGYMDGEELVDYID